MQDRELNNQDIVVIAVYAAGGSVGYVDTEDVAYQASQLAPGRFSWRKYKEQINIDTVRKRLWDAAKNKGGPLLIGSEKIGWLLTEAGLQFCKANVERANSKDLERRRLSQTEQTWATRERARIMHEMAFQKWSSGRLDDITNVEAERLFRIDDYVIGKARALRMKRALDTFMGDPVLGAAIKEIATLVRDR